MKPSPLPLSDRLRRHLEAEAPLPGLAAGDILDTANARLVACEGDRLTIERGIAELAHRADSPEAAQELRRLWLRHRTVQADIRELRRIAFKAERSARRALIPARP